MATVSKWNPFGVALDITATAGAVTRKSATQFTVVINASWEVYWSGSNTNYGMTASSGGGSATLNKFGTYASKGSGSFTGTYSISGNASASKTITVTFKNFNTDNGDSATKTINLSVTVPEWTSYTVKYDANGGSGAPSSQTKWKDQDLILSSTKPTRTGYSFQGWATSSGGSVTYNAGAKYTANASVTLYAVWKANTYTIAYNANGGSGAPSSQTKTYGVTLTLSSTKPTKDNYTFKGWGTSQSATTVSYKPGGSYTANASITLYAIWELAYIKPRITNISVTRCDSSGVSKIDGTYALVKCSWSCDRDISDAIIYWKLSTDKSYAYQQTISVTGKSGTINQVIGDAGLLTTSSYTIMILVRDSVGESNQYRTLSSMKFTIHGIPGGNGIAFGKMAEREGVAETSYQSLFTGGILHPVIEPGTDLNDIRTPNTYVGTNASSSNYVNCPLDSGSFSLEVIGMGESGQLLQRLTRCYKIDPTTYERIYYSDAWSEWTGGWIYPDLTGQFKMYGTSTSDNQVRYRKDGRTVEVRGIVTPTSEIAGSTTIHTIFTLADGYRPSSPIYVTCQGSGNCLWLLRIAASGEVGFSRYRNGGNTAACAVDTWLPFQVTFLCK